MAFTITPKKTLIALFILVSALLPLAAQEEENRQEEGILEKGEIDVSGGVSYTRWSVDDSLSNRFLFEPVVVKSLDVQFRDFTPFDLGLNYLSDGIISNLGFSAPDNLYQADTSGIRQLRLTVDTDRDSPAGWGGYIDVKSYRGSCIAAETYVWPYEGEYVEPKSTTPLITLDSTVTRLSLYRRWNRKSDDRFYLFGLYYANHKSLNGVQFSPDKRNIYTLSGLMEMKQKAVTLFYSQGIDRVIDTWHILFFFDVGYGFQFLDNPYFTRNFFSGGAMSALGKASIRKNFAIADRPSFVELGIQGNIVSHTTFGDGAKVQIDEEFSYTIPDNWDNAGDVTTAKSGDDWILEASRYDAFWGPYLEFEMRF